IFQHRQRDRTTVPGCISISPGGNTSPRSMIPQRTRVTRDEPICGEPESWTNQRSKSNLVLCLLLRRMHKVGVAIHACHSTFFEHCVRFFPILTLRIDRVGIMTAAAGDAVPPA